MICEIKGCVFDTRHVACVGPVRYVESTKDASFTVHIPGDAVTLQYDSSGPNAVNDPIKSARKDRDTLIEYMKGRTESDVFANANAI